MKSNIVASIWCFMAMAAGAADAADVQQLTWLQGCWSLQSGDRVVDEQWMAPRADSMLGMSRTVRGGKLVQHESVVLQLRDDKFDYVVSASGEAAAVTFTSTTVGPQSVLFENLARDFPQRISYRRDGAKLLAWIEGLRNGEMRRVEYPYQRVTCASD